MFPSSSSRSGSPRAPKKNPGKVVFPVVPRRGTMLGRIALAALVTSALGAGATEYLKTESPSLGLVATQPEPRPAAPAPDTENVATHGTPTMADTATPPRPAPAPPARARPAPARTVTPPKPRPPASVVAHKSDPPATRPVTAPVTLPALPPVSLDTAQPPKPGTLFVSSAPWGAVSIDGNPAGNTPVMGISLSAGPHRVRIVRDGFDPFDRVITIQPGDALRLTGIVLDAKKGP